ncbi:MAG: hypothetical protein A2161_20160 [Candidatus Schekmanbacteria bacterium RBG_13_48_7]|uniref:LUD domain-containing protein n=1 Tax=Candidatus Schekmanbacteria bacterium RBG_13_48_7 TaxID=1817878 RepID=A0A1F7RZT1_9BACT|nr:MAG: hypothetical protein A2161_20160 [Candidatus Schekmanbacteria bacterium RBG_13_48_7]
MNKQLFLNRIQTALNHTQSDLSPGTGPDIDDTLSWNPVLKEENLLKIFQESTSRVDAYCEIFSILENEFISKLEQIITRNQIKSGLVFLEDLLLICNEKSFWLNIFKRFPWIKIWVSRKTDEVTQDELTKILSNIDLVISGCCFLLADVGTAGIYSNSFSGRAGSLFSPHHIIIAKSSQLYSCFSEYLRSATKNPVNEESSALILISGPSRTADIEKTLVKGVHGPVSLSFFVITDF